MEMHTRVTARVEGMFSGLLWCVPTLPSVHPLLDTLFHLEALAQDGIFLLSPIAWLTLAGFSYLSPGSLL